MAFTLFNTAGGSPILIGDHGLIIEPEPNSERSIVTMMHNQRDGKSRITITDKFSDIVAALEPKRIGTYGGDVFPFIPHQDAQISPEALALLTRTVEMTPDQIMDAIDNAPMAVVQEIADQQLEPIVEEAATRTKTGKPRQFRGYQKKTP